jgi:hypothetical protein
VDLVVVESWESAARLHADAQLSQSTPEFLALALPDMGELRRLLAVSKPGALQQRLYRVVAQIAGLIATNINVVGDLPDTAHWFSVAASAAQRTADRTLLSWVVSLQAISFLWHGRPVEQAAEFARSAGVIAGSQPSRASALAASIEARAEARLGRHREAAAAIRRAEACFERLAPADPDLNVLGFDEHHLRFYEENVWTLLGETRAAMVAQRRALELSPSSTGIDTTVVRLDMASTLIRLGEVEEGCRVASEALLALPAASRDGVPSARAVEVLRQLAPAHRRVPAARELRVVVRDI